MAMQLVLLLGFQAIVGHLYHAIGALLACFMAGMAAGALASRRFLHRPKVLARACAGVAAVAALVPLVILGMVPVRLSPGLAGAVLFAVATLMGAAVGAVYPVAVYVAGPAAASRLYAWDLGGAAVAALVATAIAIPVLGLLPVAGFAATLAALAALVAFKAA
jgi:spermidine synthase